MPFRDIIVVGASMGGIEALQEMAAGFPPDLPAAVFVVLHVLPGHPSALPAILGRAGPLPAFHAADGMPVEHGRIYIAPPNFHMTIADSRVQVLFGPRENRTRPAVDPLFRSAAEAYGERVAGVVLTGALDDGTAGLRAIKQRGGVAIVQDPEEAIAPGMPRSALENVRVDYRMPLRKIAPLLAQLATEGDEKGGLGPPVSEEPMREDEASGTPSVYTCPECHGTLWERRDGHLTRYRCRVGHAYSASNLFEDQSEALERALWAALRTLEESASLARRLAEQAEDRGHQGVAGRFAQRAADREQHAALLRQALTRELQSRNQEPE